MNPYQTALEAKLVAEGYLTAEQLQRAKALQEKVFCPLGKALWSLNFLTYAEFLRVLAAATGRPLLLDWLTTSGRRIDPTLASAFEAALLSQTGFFPCAWQDDTTVIVAVTEPANPAVTQAVGKVWPHAEILELLARDNQILSLVVEANLEGELLASGQLTPKQWQEVRDLQANTGAPLGTVLSSLGYLGSTDYLEILSRLTGLPIFSRLIGTGFLQVDPSLMQRLAPHVMLRNRFFPLAWVGEQSLMAMVVDPLDLATEAAIFAEWPGIELVKVLGTERDVAHLLDYVSRQQFSAKVLLQVEADLSASSLHQVQVTWERTKSPLGRILTRLGFLKPIDYLDILSSLTGLPVFSRLLGTKFLQVDRSLMRYFDAEAMVKHLFFPLTWLGERSLLVLVEDPQDLSIDQIIDDRVPGVEVVKALGTEGDITRLVDHYYQEEFSRQAIFQLLARSPEESAARVFTPAQLFVLYVGLMACVWNLSSDWWGTLRVALALLSGFYVAAVLFKLCVSLLGWARQSQRRVGVEDVAAVSDESLPLYTVLVPVYNEPAVVPLLLQALSRLDYPHEKLDVLLLLEEKDLATIAAAKAANPPRYIRFIYIPDSHPKTKPKACNYGLAFARGEYVTIYDAEDIPDPDQLRKAIAAFRRGSDRLVCVQAALNYFNRDENFLTRMFTLEYSYWFDCLLPGLEALRLPIPLGGTSNHFRTERLRELGGWDPFNVTEDADLGIRASQRGYTVGVIHSTTYEEANCRLKNWLRQRSRWIKGYMQTWLVHNRHPWRSLRALGVQNWLAYQFFIGGTIIMFLSSPILWGLFVYWLLTQADWLVRIFPPGWALYTALFNLILGNALAVYLNITAVFSRGYYELLPYAFLNPLYWQLHSIAAYLALWQLFTKPFYWEKTHHGLTKFARPEAAPGREEVRSAWP
jgi:cellulose synthase/poly-beta-1,6-N-acetylglucosamine synthase-like glycosyltransferase